MRAPVLALGIILLAVGGILFLMGPTTYQVPYTDKVTSDKSSAILSSQTRTVDPGYYYYFYDSVDISGKDSGTVRITGSFTVSGGYGIDFYLFDSTNYNNWKQSYSTTWLNKGAWVSSHTFNVPISQSGTYYFVFDNTAGSYSKTFTVTATLVWKETQTVTKYRTEYDYTRGQVGVVIAVSGLVCAIVGAALKGKKAPPPPTAPPAPPAPAVPPVQPPPVYQPPPPPPGFKRCPYCGTQMPAQATFCGVCGRRLS